MDVMFRFGSLRYRSVCFGITMRSLVGQVCVRLMSDVQFPPIYPTA